MLATEITNHVQQALARLMQQYKGLPNLTAFITALVDQVQDLEDALFSLNDGRQLYNGNAQGAQLDGIGDIVGIKRNGLSDAEYLVFILGTIAENNSDTTLSIILSILTLLLDTQTVLLFELFPAGIAFQVQGATLDSALWPVVANIVQSSLGAAIELCFISQFDANSFAFDGGPFPGLGFDDLTDPGHGGEFVGYEYSVST